MPDVIALNDIRLSIQIGIRPDEIGRLQPIVVDFSFAIAAEKIAATDNLQHAVDYTKIYDRLCHHLQNANCKLLETLAERVAKALKNEFELAWLRLAITKVEAIPAIPGVKIVIERS